MAILDTLIAEANSLSSITNPDPSSVGAVVRQYANMLDGVPQDLQNAVVRDLATNQYEFGNDNALYVKGYAPKDPVAQAQMSQEDIVAAEKRQVGHMANMVSMLTKYAPSVNITKVANSFMNNGNPEYLGGFGQISFGDKSYNIPNAVLQSIQFRQNTNPTTWNQQEFWSSGQMNAAADAIAKTGQKPYVSYDVAGQMIDYKNKKWGQYIGTDNTELDYTKAAASKSINISNQIKALQEQAQRGLTESVTATGQITGGTHQQWQKQMQDLQAQQAQAAQEYRNVDTRGDRVRGAERAAGLTDQMAKDYEKIFTPTVSNLPITERVFFDQVKANN